MANSTSTAVQQCSQVSSSHSSPNKALLLNCISNSALFQDILKEWTDDPDCCHTSNYCWSVQNKYYSTNIILQSYSLEAGTHTFKIDNEHYEAAVIFLDCTQTDDTFLEDVKKAWSTVSQQLKGMMEVEGQRMPDIRLLLAVVGGKDKRERECMQNVLEWSVKEGFEMIKWSVATASHSNSQHQLQEEEEEEGGTVRLAEALQAHMWPEMIIRSGTSCEQQLLLHSNLMNHTPPSPSSSPAAAAAANLTVALEHCYNSAEEKLLAEGLDPAQDPGPGGENFEHLFARFAGMKVHADKLAHEEKKEYAEKVVMAFWNAIGGEEEEMNESL